ncbi:MAG: sulfite reductase subunit A [Actinomycetales bacterium]|nr:sulfite reductase subunit A [Actinomycetales bacterium]
MATDTSSVLLPDALEVIVQELRGRGWRVVAPVRRNDAVVHDEITSVTELPIGWHDVQTPGSYRLEHRGDGAFFGYAVGPDSWKRELFPPRAALLSARRDGRASTDGPGDTAGTGTDDGAGFVVTPAVPDRRRSAFLGVRSCEVAAMEIQDRVLLHGHHVDEDYRARRAQAFVIAVNCTAPASTCFCASTGTGPAVRAGADLVLTEILDDDHRFLAEVGTTEGAELLDLVPRRPAEPADVAAAARAVQAARHRMGVTLDTEGLHDLLLGNLEHPRLDDVADRCLCCTNCTLACPTCFCTTIEDATDLSGDVAERTRVWDSCFTLRYSEMHGGRTRTSARARYRQWLTHKLATWVDQFGSLGCVGCGRCITWCPVGIDLRAEVAAIRADQEAGAGREGASR